MQRISVTFFVYSVAARNRWVRRWNGRRNGRSAASRNDGGDYRSCIHRVAWARWLRLRRRCCAV